MRILTIDVVIMFWGFYREDVGLYVNNAIIIQADIGARGYILDMAIYSKSPEDNYETDLLREVIRYSLRRHNLIA